MADDSVPVKNAPHTWGAAARLLQKGEGNVTDADIFGDDPLAPTKKKDPLEYLGHFASDSVTEEGHNTPNVKRVGAGPHAKQGFRVIPGNANTGYVTKKVREALDVAASSAYRYGGPIAPGPCGPMPGTDPKMPLRERDRAAKVAAGPGKGPLRSKRG